MRKVNALSSSRLIIRFQSPRFFLLFFFVFLILKIDAQLITSGSNSGTVATSGVALRDPSYKPNPAGITTGFQTFITFTARGGLKLPSFENMEGSPFLHPEYNLAQVRVQTGFTAASVMVRFNIYGNEVIFIQNGSELALDSVDFVSYTSVGKNGVVETIKLKTGFPAIGTNTKQTIYQLLDSGAKVQLLKYHYQKVGELKSMGAAPRKEFITFQELYINTPLGGMKKIKADLKSLQEALPEYAEQIEKIVSEKKLKLKKESDLILLIAELNNQSKPF